MENESELGWVTADKLVLTLNNDFYLINLSHSNLTDVKKKVKYGLQQVNLGLFCSIVAASKTRPLAKVSSIK